MRFLKYVALAAVLMVPMALTPSTQAQVAVGIGVGVPVYGPPPVCEYGYYNSYPYACAPYGYYGPEWFDGGVFIGVGPWYRGYGYRGLGYGYGFRGGYGYGGIHPGYGYRGGVAYGAGRGYASGGTRGFSTVSGGARGFSSGGGGGFRGGSVGRGSGGRR